MTQRYRLVQIKMNWTEAHAYCEDTLDAKLAIINSVKEMMTMQAELERFNYGRFFLNF